MGYGRCGATIHISDSTKNLDGNKESLASTTIDQILTTTNQEVSQRACTFQHLPRVWPILQENWLLRQRAWPPTPRPCPLPQRPLPLTKRSCLPQRACPPPHRARQAQQIERLLHRHSEPAKQQLRVQSQSHRNKERQLIVSGRSRILNAPDFNQRDL
ncbi:hypothetical protein FGO68_gene16847 [Halteria grandinella]|uniref:Uncharacterized protein n=1 Tax=Halteria grandinella TaxID=5974 RepID=A0A8J8SVJ1_HALGN|nr:hypothetical protein FGO68_gene16847 [Halteria grandinella]